MRLFSHALTHAVCVDIDMSGIYRHVIKYIQAYRHTTHRRLVLFLLSHALVHTTREVGFLCLRLLIVRHKLPEVGVLSGRGDWFGWTTGGGRQEKVEYTQM